MRKKDFLSYLALGAILVTLYVFLSNFQDALGSVLSFISSSFKTLLMGVAIAFILNIPVNFFERHLRRCKVRPAAKAARGLSILAAILAFAIAIFLILGFILPSFVDALGVIMDALGQLSGRIQEGVDVDQARIEELLNNLLDWLGLTLEELTTEISDFLRRSSPRFITTTLNTIVGTVSSIVSFFVALVAAIYFLTYKELLKRHFNSLVSLIFRKKQKVVEGIGHIGTLVFHTFSRFITAQLLEAVIIGSLCFLGMLILGLPNAAMTGVLVGVTALIPVYGAFVGAILGAVMIAVASPWQAVGFIVYIIVLQQLEGNFIYPRVVGNSLGLPPVYTFSLVTICGAAFGILGMLLAVPAGSIAFTLLKEWKIRRDEAARQGLMG